MPRIEYADHVRAVERETRLIVAALGGGPLDVRVPSCPEWTLADLAEHIGGFTGFWTHVLCEGTGRPKTPFADLVPGGAVADWYEELAGHLVAELRGAPPDTEVWTWAPQDKSARFVARRATHELSVHRFDAQLARGHPEPIAGAIAADGIDEVFFMIAASPERVGRGEGQTLHLHGIDRGDEWLLTLHPDGLQVDRQHAKADLALRGTVSDLELLLYQRAPRGEVERHGDESVLDAWYRVFTFG